MADKLLKSLDFGTGDKYYPSTKWEYVENPPTIPTKTSELENDSNFVEKGVTDALSDEIGNKVSQVQMENYINETFLGGAW